MLNPSSLPVVCSLASLLPSFCGLSDIPAISELEEQVKERELLGFNLPGLAEDAAKVKGQLGGG